MAAREAIARRSCAALGYNECVFLQLLSISTGAFVAHRDHPVWRPSSTDMSHIAPVAVPAFCKPRPQSGRVASPYALFESGPVFTGGRNRADQHLKSRSFWIVVRAPKTCMASRPVDVSSKSVSRAVLASIGARPKCRSLQRSDLVPSGRHGQNLPGPKSAWCLLVENSPRVRGI